MKQAWGILCVSLIACSRIALCDGASSVSPPTVPAAASAQTSAKAVWPTSNAPTHRIKENGVPNFGKLNNCFWRSGQPTREGYQHLATEGLKTVINLRAEFPQDKDLIPQGVRYLYIPIKDEHAPTAEQAKAFLDAAANPDNWPLLVHCEGGQGRAGVMSALARRLFDGWDYNKVMQEVGNFRSKVLGFISVPMAASQRDFIQHYETTTGPSKQQPVAAAAGS